MRFANRKFRKYVAMFGLAGLVGLGCGQSPLSQQAEQVELSPVVRAAKKGGQMHTTTTSTDAGLGDSATSETLYVQSDFRNFKPGVGDAIRVTMPEYGDAHTVRLKKAIFEVPDGALNQRVRITMTCYSGTTVEDVNVVFDPSGLTFESPAHLTLYLRGPVTAEDVMHVEHIYGSGANVESILTETSNNGEAFLVIRFHIPGFSRYSLGGDR